MQVPIIKIFVSWRPKKASKVPFFRLGGNTGANANVTIFYSSF